MTLTCPLVAFEIFTQFSRSFELNVLLITKYRLRNIANDITTTNVLTYARATTVTSKIIEELKKSIVGKINPLTTALVFVSTASSTILLEVFVCSSYSKNNLRLNIDRLISEPK